MTRRIRSLATWLMILTLTIGSGTFGALAQEGDAGESLFEAVDIDATLLAQADLAELDAGSTLTLELIELAPETELAAHQTTSPELFYVLTGVATFEDDFGFVSAIDAGRVVSLNTGTGYTVSNANSEAARLLRLSLADGAAAPPSATPAADSGDGGTTTLMQAPLDGIELDSARMYLGRAQFGANTDSGDQSHAGPLGIYVESGALNVVSPSGLVGGVDAGRAVSLPATTPLRASTGESEAVVFLAGIAGTEGELFTRVAGGGGLPVAGDILDGGDSWFTPTAELTVDYEQYASVLRFNLTYSNLDESAVDLTLDRNALSVTDDDGQDWLYIRSDCTAESDQATATCVVDFKPPAGTPRGPKVLTFHVDAFGDIQDAAWQVEIDW